MGFIILGVKLYCREVNNVILCGVKNLKYIVIGDELWEEFKYWCFFGFVEGLCKVEVREL